MDDLEENPYFWKHPYTEMNAQTLFWLACNNLYIDSKERERESQLNSVGIYS